ncbi:hypothetical protein KGM_215585 [Danaus plexippus plexippus]|uniref:Uncharacterized protein n=1 Tax=Danaus plexippus plexippus TaxID=278856 RepID=A0A212ERX5_DANPL|nr:hypothetical protein KGM_215585 [Danaus plexippus plexippus]
MVRLQILLLVVSSVLTTVYSIDNDDLNTKAPSKSNAKLIYSVIQRRRHQAPHEEIKDEDVGRYIRRPPQTTTAPSIFSMKVENTYQNVYPNERSSDKKIYPKRNQTNTDNTGVSSKRSIMKMPIERIAMRTKNLSRKIPFAKRYHPAVAEPITSFNDGNLEEQKVETESMSTATSTTTTITTTSTTPESVVLDTIGKEQTRKESVADSKNLFSFPSRTLEISEDIMALNQNSEELSELKFITQTSKPISTTVKTLEESVPTSIYIPNIMSQTRRRRPHFAKKVHMQPIMETVTINDNLVLSTSAPTLYATTEMKRGKKTISPSHEQDLPSITKTPKLRRRLLNRDSLNRGSQKFSSEELRRQQTDTSLDESHSTSSQGTLFTLNNEKSTSLVPMTSPKPPPVPTLSPWYDGFGK